MDPYQTRPQQPRRTPAPAVLRAAPAPRRNQPPHAAAPHHCRIHSLSSWDQMLLWLILGSGHISAHCFRVFIIHEDQR
ncbi:hypothetical protein ACS0TY_005818 [Phlomoides rotata]